MNKTLIVCTALFIFGSTLNASAQTRLLQTSGKINFLRVHEVGDLYGPPSDRAAGEVIVRFSNKEGAFGFQLRDDTNTLTHQGMLDILRDAFIHQFQVTINYEIANGKKNGRITRVWIQKASQTTLGGVLGKG